MIPIFKINIQNGKLEFEDKQKFKSYVSSLFGSFELLIRKPKKKRSNEANRYYWGVVIKILCDYFGYDADEMHEALKWQFLRIDKPLPTVGSTAKLSTVAFEEFLEKIRRWALCDYNIIIPLPNEINIDEYNYKE